MILTPDQRLRVFVSSTLGELAAERAAVREVIQSLHLAPVMFELGARPHPPRALYRAYLEQSHVFLAVYADRYGWVAPTMDISGLEDEFRLSGERPKLVYVREPAPDREPRLAEMLGDVAADPRVRLRTFGSVPELAAMVADDLAATLAEAFAVPRPRDRSEPATPARSPTHALPAATTSMVGRTREIAAVTGLVTRRDVRLVTVTGMGGIGKSRLALEVARRCADSFPGGAHHVALSAVAVPGLVMASVAGTLGIRVDGSTPPLDAVADALALRGDVLVVLDNAEHVPDAADDLAALIAACPDLTMLVTSRKRLRLAAELDFPVQPLDTGPGPRFARPGVSWSDKQLTQAADCDAVTLFLDRSRDVRPDLDMRSDPVALRAVVELCRRLDGVPLAIELAAARIRLLSPSQILDRFCRSLDLPAERLADLPERQQTMRATLDWSLQLLHDDERSLLAQLSTFVGGASLASVEQVCRIDGDLLEAVAGLVDHSLVDVDLTVPDPPRFTMLGTVRDYGRELLSASPALSWVDQAHRGWVTDLARRARDGLPGPAHAEWVARLELEAGNIRAAGIRADRAGDAVAVVEVGFAVWLWLWVAHHAGEARAWLERELPAEAGMSAVQRGHLRWSLAAACIALADADAGREHLGAAESAFAAATAEQAAGAAVTPAERAEVAEGEALCRFLRATMGPSDGAADDGAAMLARSAQVFTDTVPNPYLASMCWAMAGTAEAQHGDYEAAEHHLARALDIADANGNVTLRGQALVARAVGRLRAGRLDDAEADLGAGAKEAAAAGDIATLALAADGCAALLLLRGSPDPELTARLAAGAAGLRESHGVVAWRPVRAAIAEIERTARKAVDPVRLETLWQEARRGDRDALYGLVTQAVGRSERSRHAEVREVAG